MLDINGYILQTKALKKIQINKNQNKHKGSLDMELGLEMVELVNNYDTAILMVIYQENLLKEQNMSISAN